MGRAQGEQLRERVHAAFDTVANLEAVRLMKPFALPFRWFLRVAESKAERFLQRAFAAVPVAAKERLRGIADGAGVPFRKLALCSALEAVLSDLRPVTVVAAGAGCSALAVTRSASKDGRPILAHNFDYLPVTQPFYFIRRSQPAEQLASVELSLAPLAGAVTGLNEAGLAIVCNYAYATDKSSPAPTITMLIAEALARFQRLDEACEFFAATPRTGGGLLMLADADGAIASLEISNTRVRRRDPPSIPPLARGGLRGGRDRLCHTNRFCRPEMGDVELSPAAVYGKNAPHALRGRRVHQSAEDRDAAFRQLIDQRDCYDRDDVRDVLSNHGPDGRPSLGTICMHSDYWHTTASLQLFPAERLLRASFSPTCVAEYREFSLQPAAAMAR